MALRAEVAGVREVGGPGLEDAQPEVVPPVAEGASELQQVVADTALVVPARSFLSDSHVSSGSTW